MQAASRQDNRAMRCKANDSSSTSSATIPAATWSNMDSTDQEFIDLGPFRNQNQTSQVRPIISSSRVQLNLRFFKGETRAYYKNNSLTVFLHVWRLRRRHCLLIRLFVRALQDYLLSYGGKDARGTSEHNDFVADFERANFDEGRKLVEKSNFEELQKASLDLEKRLHERIMKNAEIKFEDPNGRLDVRQRQGAMSRHNR